MKVTYNWLKEFVDFDLSADALSELLTMLGLEVEGIQKIGEGMDDVVVAVVEEKRQHPNADKLSLCRVNNGREILDVVCGAQNFKAGDTVALAQVGSVLPGEFKIKKSKIRGEDSSGMLCSEKELALADESAGIMILPDGLQPGMSVFDALGIKDTIFEIGLTPNRADCLSVAGVAREIAAKLDIPFRYPDVAVPEALQKASDVIGVTLEDPEGCPRYAARYISGCKIGPSPEWMVKRLAALGIRSINNVVDVTNYVMMELGHPLHAFDCDNMAENRIVVRKARTDECFVTLDGQERTLGPDDVVICDAVRPVALAGIMGGQNSEISDTTANILLESAWFKPSMIRRTSKRLGLHTESSHRFERGADIDMVPRAIDRAASLMAELSGGTVAAGIIDAYPVPVTPPSIQFRPEKAVAVIGIEIAADMMASILKGLCCRVERNDNDGWQVTPPSYRIDLEREIDLIEEIARVNGFDRIPATMPMASVFSDRPTHHQRMERAVRDQLTSMGLNEIINFSFIGPDAADKMLLPEDDSRRSAIRLCNPLADEQSVMRTSLLPGLLTTAARNINHRELDLRLFEMRRVYLPDPGKDMPSEPIFVSGLVTGRRNESRWCLGKEAVDFYDLKGILETVFEVLQINGVRWTGNAPEPFYHPGISCTVTARKEVLGTIGQIHPGVLENFEITQPVYYFELNFEKLAVVSANARKSIVPPSRYPGSSRDTAILLPEEVSAEKVINCIVSLKNEAIESANIFDIYRGAGIPEGHKSMAIRVNYRLFERTLSDEEIAGMHNAIVDHLKEHLGAVTR